MVIHRTSQAKTYLRMTILLFVSFFVLRYYFSLHKSSAWSGAPLNATLGFGALYVLTEDTSTWRVQGLLSAAEVTGLHFTVPVQRRPTDHDVLSHLDGDEATTVPDGIRAVLNYISLLEIFLRSGYETALFVEDDVDFSIHIKSQMLNISNTISDHIIPDDAEELDRKLHPTTKPQSIQYPYGKDAWDILWIGHFGVEYTSKTVVWKYRDPHALPWDRLTSKFNHYYQLAEADQEQQVLSNVAPMASYAFALGRPAAERLVRKLREDKAQKFDVAVHIECKGLNMLCIAPAPELMHHHKVDGQRSLSSEGTQDDGIHNIDSWRYRHKYTYNLEWSARCIAEHAGERIGDRWKCLPNLYDSNL